MTFPSTFWMTAQETEDVINHETMWKRAQAMTRNHNNEAFMSQFTMRIEKNEHCIGNSQLYAVAPDGAEFHYNGPMHSWEPA